MKETLALSLRQPWLHLIHPGVGGCPKRIENRTRALFQDWDGRSLWLHAAKGDKREDWGAAIAWVMARFTGLHLTDFPLFSDVARGGIVARATIVGLIQPDGTPVPGSQTEGVDLRWHMTGQWGYVLGEVTPTVFLPMRGQQGLWRLSTDELQRLF